MCEKHLRHIVLREESTESSVQKRAGRSYAEQSSQLALRDAIEGTQPSLLEVYV